MSPLPPDSAADLPLLQAVLALYQQADALTEPALHAQAIEAAVALTGSEIGYIHLVNPDQESIELGTWSAATLRQCQAVYERHYPLSAAGIWADCARERRALIHNDFASLPQRRGYPDGHVPLRRHLGVPVLQAGKVVLLLGVGNKVAPYTDADLQLAQTLADHTWQAIVRCRRLRALEESERQFNDLRQLAALCLWQWDPDEASLSFDPQIDVLLRTPVGCYQPWMLDDWLRYVDTRDHLLLLDALRARQVGRCFDVQLRVVRADGTPSVLHVRGTVCPRSQGHGVILRGVVQDISERIEAEQARFQANHDALTGLANRKRLLAELAPRLNHGQRRPADCLAVHFIDLDRFKPVNDQFGHAVGDEVLKAVAGRLLRLTRKDDLVARIGGDEMVVVQQHATDLQQAESLAGKIVAAIEQPIAVGAVTVQVGASVGIVLAMPGDGRSAEALIAAADAAMYRVKQRGRGGYGI